MTNHDQEYASMMAAQQMNAFSQQQAQMQRASNYRLDPIRELNEAKEALSLSDAKCARLEIALKDALDVNGWKERADRAEQRANRLSDQLGSLRTAIDAANRQCGRLVGELIKAGVKKWAHEDD